MVIEAKGLFKILKERHEYLYHFTDSRNIESIKKDGILSLAMIKNNGMNVCFGGNEISHEQDKIIGMDAYVHLSFTRSHPMIKSAKDSGRILVTKKFKLPQKFWKMREYYLPMG